MKVVVVTSFAPHHWATHAKRMVESFLQHWPVEVSLWIYYEHQKPSVDNPRVTMVDLMTLPNGVTHFVERYGHIQKWHGMLPDRKKEDFRFNAVKFCRKPFAVEHCGLRSEAEVLLWLDADSLTFSDVPMTFLEGLLPEPFYLSHLGRAGYHSDCSLFGLRVGHPAHKEFLDRYAGMYRSGRFEQEREAHDSFLFDLVRTEMEQEQKIRSYNLSDTDRGHVFINSRLGQYMDTCKGARKRLGHSKPTDLVVNRQEPYWLKVKASAEPR